MTNATVPTTRLSPGIHTAQTGGLNFHYTVGGSGPLLVVLVPGWGIGAGYLAHGLLALQRHFTVLSYDPLGNGLSSRPANEQDMGTPFMIADLESLRCYWGAEQIALLGHSSSGAVALGYAAQFPDRVSKLGLIDSDLLGHDGSAAFAAFADERKNDPVYGPALATLTSTNPQTDEEFKELLAAILPYYLHEPVTNLAPLAATITDEPSLWAYRAYYGADRTTPIRQAPLLAQIRAATLVIAGVADPFCGVSTARAIRAGIADSALVTFHGSGHFPWIEEPALFFETVIGFLKTLSSSGIGEADRRC